MLQGHEELGKRRGELHQILDPPEGGGLAFDPPVDGPRPGIAVCRNASRQRNGDRQREVRREMRQPPVFFLHLCHVSLRARQPYHHALSEAEGPVVPALGHGRRYGQIRPVRKLRGDQTPHEGCVDVDLVGMHSFCWLPPPYTRCAMRSRYSLRSSGFLSVRGRVGISPTTCW